MDSGLGFRLFLEGDELISMSAEYPYGEQFWADHLGAEGVCCCDSVCNGSEIKTSLRMPFEFVNPRPTNEWTEERIRSAADIPEGEKEEVVEYIRSTACLRHVVGSASAETAAAQQSAKNTSTFFEEIIRAETVLSEDPVDDIWNEEMAKVPRGFAVRFFSDFFDTWMQFWGALDNEDDVLVEIMAKEGTEVCIVCSAYDNMHMIMLSTGHLEHEEHAAGVVRCYVPKQFDGFYARLIPGVDQAGTHCGFGGWGYRQEASLLRFIHPPRGALACFACFVRA
jgi:hypothetical protein